MTNLNQLNWYDSKALCDFMEREKYKLIPNFFHSAWGYVVPITDLEVKGVLMESVEIINGQKVRKYYNGERS